MARSGDAASVDLGGETLRGTTAKFAMAAIGLLGAVVFARLLGPAAFGAFYLVLASVEIADRPITGVAVAAKKRFSEVEGDASRVVGSQLVASALWLLVIGGLAWLIAGELRAYTGLENAVILFVVLLATTVFFEPLSLVLQATGRVSLAKWIDAVRSVLTFPAQLIFVLAGLGAAGMVLGLAAATALSVPVVLYYLGTIPSFPDRATVRSLGRFGRFSVPNTLVGKAYERFDLLLLGVLMTSTEAGYYEVAAMLTLPAWFVAEVAGEGLMARVSALQSRGEPVAEDVTNTLSFASALALPVFVGSLVVARPTVVTVFDPRFAPASALVVGLALYRVVQTQSWSLMQAIDGLDRPDLTMRYSAVGLAVNVVLGVALVIEFGAIGVVAATVIAEVVKYVAFATVVARRLPDARLVSRPFVEQVVAAVVMGLAVVGVHRGIPVASWVDLAVILAVGGATYSLVLLAISERLRVTLRSAVAGTPLEPYVPW